MECHHPFYFIKNCETEDEFYEKYLGEKSFVGFEPKNRIKYCYSRIGVTLIHHLDLLYGLFDDLQFIGRISMGGHSDT